VNAGTRGEGEGRSCAAFGATSTPLSSVGSGGQTASKVGDQALATGLCSNTDLTGEGAPSTVTNTGGAPASALVVVISNGTVVEVAAMVITATGEETDVKVAAEMVARTGESTATSWVWRARHRWRLAPETRPPRPGK